MKIPFKTIGVYLILIAVAFNCIETAYFGFNAKAMSRPEEICDTISKMFANVGILFLALNFILKERP